MQHTIITFLSNYGYIAIAILMLAESACIPVPSEVTMLVGGALTNSAFVATTTTNGHPLNLIAVGVIGTLANLAGSLLAWYVGWKGGRPLVERYGRIIFLNTKHLDNADRWFEKNGVASVFFSRLLPIVRTFISLPAGIARMRIGRFSAYTVLGCLPWTFALAIAGHALGSQWTKVEHAMKPLTYIVAAAVVVAAIWWIKSQIRTRQPQP